MHMHTMSCTHTLQTNKCSSNMMSMYMYQYIKWGIFSWYTFNVRCGRDRGCGCETIATAVKAQKCPTCDTFHKCLHLTLVTQITELAIPLDITPFRTDVVV